MLVLSDRYEPRYKRRVQCFLHVSRGLQRNITSTDPFQFMIIHLRWWLGLLGKKGGKGSCGRALTEQRSYYLTTGVHAECGQMPGSRQSLLLICKKYKSISKQCHLVQVYSWYRQPKSLQQSRNVLIYEQLHLPNHDRVSIMDTYLSNTEQKQVT